MDVTFPDGNYVKLREPAYLTTDHQDDYFDLGTELREKKEAAMAAAAAPAFNPAMVAAGPAERPEVRLGRKELRPVQDLVFSWIVVESTYPGQVPWGPDSRKAMPLLHWNKLLKAADAHFDALNGEGPKEAGETGTGSAAT